MYVSVRGFNLISLFRFHWPVHPCQYYHDCPACITELRYHCLSQKPTDTNVPYIAFTSSHHSVNWSSQYYCIPGPCAFPRSKKTCVIATIQLNWQWFGCWFESRNCTWCTCLYLADSRTVRCEAPSVSRMHLRLPVQSVASASVTAFRKNPCLDDAIVMLPNVKCKLRRNSFHLQMVKNCGGRLCDLIPPMSSKIPTKKKKSPLWRAVPHSSESTKTPSCECQCPYS